MRRWLAARLSKKAAARVANELAASNAECKYDFGMQLPLQLLGSAALLQLARSNVDSSLVTVGADTYGGHDVIVSGQCVTVIRSNVYIPIIQQGESD